jgi:hypothetical protein
MAGPKTRVCFEGSQGSVELAPERFEFPELETGWDANWIVGEVILTDDGDVRGSLVQPLFLRTDELEKLSQDLESMLDGKSELVSTDHIEEQYGIEIRRDAERVVIDAWVSDHEKRFELAGIEMEVSRLADTHRQLALAMAVFPVKGDPFGS